MRLSKIWKIGLASLTLVLLLYGAHPLYLTWIGRFLVVSGPLNRSDAIVVLDGDSSRDERLLHAIKLWQSGYAPRIVLSAKLAEWQSYEDYPEWRHAVKLNTLPKDSLLVAVHDADSTKEEAEALLPFVQKHGYKTVIIVTSNYHTRRTKKVFQGQWKGTGISLSISASPCFQFHPDEWWRHRADSRTFFFEFSKTLWYALLE